MHLRKLVGIVLILFGIAVLAFFLLASLLRPDGATEGGQQRVRVTDTRALDPYGSGGFRTGDAPRVELPDAPGPGELFHLSGEPGPDGDGSRDRPWRSLTRALCHLRPGDRLVVLAGEFEGPIRIDEPCRHGAEDKPIEVYFHDDVVLGGRSEPEGDDRPVLAIHRSHWTIAGLQVLPERSAVAIAVAPGVEGVRLDSVKINRGAGVGVRIGHGAADIELLELHVHHMGIPAGGSSESDHEEESAGRLVGGVLIEPGARSVRIRESKFHNIRGEMVRAIAPDAFEAVPDLPVADYHVDDKTYFAGHQEPW